MSEFSEIIASSKPTPCRLLRHMVWTLPHAVAHP